MANNNIGGVISSFQKYIFHFLPGLPVLAGLCIIFWHLGFDLAVMSKVIHKLQLSSRDLPGFTFFLILLALVLLTVLLLGMIVDGVRHALEYAFLIPKRKEYWIARRIKEPPNEPKHLMLKLDIFIRFHETEYFYIEFFGNVALSLAFLWGVMLWYPCILPLKLPGLFMLSMHVVFILRPLSAPLIWKFSGVEDKQEEEIGWIKECFCRILDFWATLVSILVLLYLWFSEYKCSVHVAPYHFYFIGTLIILSSFEVYIVRFRRYREMLEEGLFFKHDCREGKRSTFPF